MHTSSLSTSFSRLTIGTTVLAAILATGCSKAIQVENLGEPPANVGISMVLKNQKYKPIYDQLTSLENALEKFSNKAVRATKLGHDLNSYEIKNKDIGVVRDLQKELAKTHAAILVFLSDPALNPNGRFAATGVEVSGAIGDAERSLASIRNESQDWYDWMASADTMEDSRRLHHEIQAFRADIASIRQSPAPGELPVAAR